MSLSSIWRVLLRRWYVSVFGLLLTVALGVGGALLSPPTYEAHATVLLVPPKTNQQLNPYLNLGGLQEPSDAISRAMSNTETSDAILAAGGSGKYSVARDTSTSGPIILITTDASTGATALKTTQLLINRMAPVFDKLQANQNVPDGSYITITVLAQDDKATKQTKSQLRSIIALAAVGLILTVLMVGFAEKSLTRRAKAKRGDAAAEPVEPAAVEPGPRNQPQRDGRSGRRAEQRADSERRQEPGQRREPEQRRNQRRAAGRQQPPRTEVPDGEVGLFDELSSVSDHDAPTRR